MTVVATTQKEKKTVGFCRPGHVFNAYGNSARGKDAGVLMQDG
jgi:hypothetical protein